MKEVTVTTLLETTEVIHCEDYKLVPFEEMVKKFRSRFPNVNHVQIIKRNVTECEIPDQQ